MGGAATHPFHVATTVQACAAAAFLVGFAQLGFSLLLISFFVSFRLFSSSFDPLRRTRMLF
jgi:hypothetical protein